MIRCALLSTPQPAAAAASGVKNKIQWKSREFHTRQQQRMAQELTSAGAQRGLPRRTCMRKFGSTHDSRSEMCVITSCQGGPSGLLPPSGTTVSSPTCLPAGPDMHHSALCWTVACCRRRPHFEGAARPGGKAAHCEMSLCHAFCVRVRRCLIVTPIHPYLRMEADHCRQRSLPHPQSATARQLLWWCRRLLPILWSLRWFRQRAGEHSRACHAAALLAPHWRTVVVRPGG